MILGFLSTDLCILRWIKERKSGKKGGKGEDEEEEEWKRMKLYCKKLI